MPPSHATAEHGDRMLDALAAHLADFVAEARTLDVEVTDRDFPERAR